MDEMTLHPIAYIRNAFTDKFGIPRQAGLLQHSLSRIVFLPEFRNPAALRGLEGFDYIWLLWGFSANHDRPVAATVKPPRLGGHKRMGVFATRSPYRPNQIGLSSVRIVQIDLETEEGPVITVQGADLLNGTPIYDIKPYLEYADAHTGIRSGFADQTAYLTAEVHFDMAIAEASQMPEETQLAVEEILAQDPRPAYDRNKDRSYKMAYGGYDITFHGVTEDDKPMITVDAVERIT